MTLITLQKREMSTVGSRINLRLFCVFSVFTFHLICHLSLPSLLGPHTTDPLQNLFDTRVTVTVREPSGFTRPSDHVCLSSLIRVLFAYCPLTSSVNLTSSFNLYRFHTCIQFNVDLLFNVKTVTLFAINSF